MKPFRFLFVVIFAVSLAVALSSAAPLPAAHATNDVPDGLSAADWAQIKSQLLAPTNAVLNEDAKLTASDAAAEDSFGWSVAMSGHTAIIGAYGNDDSGNSSGSAYIFVKNGGIWSEQAKLTPTDASAFQIFGYSVAISGDTAVIGAYGDGNSSGSAYVFVRSGTSWSEQSKLVADDAGFNDQFGYTVSVSGDTAVIGARLDDDGGLDSGAAYVFVRNGTSWSQQAKLTADDAAGEDWFAYLVAVSGDTAVIGAPFDDDGDANSGSAYVFVRSGTSWSQQAKLTASDASVGAVFGWGVALSGDTAVIGAYENEAAYVFVRSGTNWSEQAKLTANDSTAGDSFGWLVAVEGDTAVIGAFKGNNEGGIESGSAYVFKRNGANWTQRDKLVSSDFAEGDYFGYGAAISGNTVVVGAPRNDDDGSTSGSAYIFSLDNNPLTITKFGMGSGNVVSDPSGISCGLTCKASFIISTTVTLTATADLGSTFTGWSGDVVSTDNPITVTMDNAKAITATFALVPEEGTAVYLPLVMR
jgi:hypothetical protein